MNAVAIHLDGALADTGRLWQDWRADARRRFRLEGAPNEELPN